MKKSIAGLLIAISCLALSCEKQGDILCENDCLFFGYNLEGEIVMLHCFNRFGIKTTHPDGEELIIGIPDQLAGRFQEEGKLVKFTATFRANTLQPLFPDPSIDIRTIYQARVQSIQPRK
ncbi:hypothetical protein [Flavilitoribacter nigricans]|uniref:Lipoprotein n=1 Tax=Flavilitoribacter nigricans (strain ATCC 23147 / DSM 23189 / NBRC 102662 / NCIMB 1420 / SS-2) TaxID=1122177 RepID=A0A2D0MZD8_FLAN2|nr:hypothetical protein [Flavilitoribacter nigricans]PHN01540.1 hypothetical protein CRP01_36690 [Flavilitoribacter nigricans DSM 23189 = NBRC 102662]